MNGNYHVLVAEDNGVLLDVLRFNLERAGFRVTTAANGRLAVEALQSEDFDLLITDYQMPEVDGGELCRHVREMTRNGQMPIMMVSAKGLEIDADELQRQFQVDKVIFKPFSVRAIVSSAEQLCNASTTSVGN